ncbi:MAG: prephenate dehydrogenase/arogenate dehydrogenase family protein, partial [Candidatus Omnitrophica bacterium]|nr:prephenate dehydrogenase/arogenate dehydrogenase family protein [Candidatus Omnitrophota bacterium]
AVINTDLVVLATPVSIIHGMLSMIGPHLKRGCIVTDVGSSKEEIVNAAREMLPPHVSFVGSHPMAGSEKRGVQHATAELFEGSQCILTPTENTNRGALEKVRRFWTRVGCKIKILSPEEHDKILANVSHVPHIMSYALMEAIPESYLVYAAGGLKDTTRIASSSPQMWNDICLGNSKNIIAALDEVVKKLSGIRKAMSMADQKALIQHFQTAKNKRDKLG